MSQPGTWSRTMILVTAAAGHAGYCGHPGVGGRHKRQDEPLKRDDQAYLPPCGEGVGGWGALSFCATGVRCLDPHPFIPSPQGEGMRLASRLRPCPSAYEG